MDICKIFTNLYSKLFFRSSLLEIIKKSKLVYKSFRKGKVKVILPPVFNDGQEIEVVAKYELPSKFKIRLDFKQVFMRSVTIFLPIDSVKFEFDYKSKNKAIENELLEQLRHKIKMKFVHFDSNCDLIFTKYPDAFRNADDHIVKEEESKHTHLIKKIPLVYKALKKGTIELTIHEWDYDRIKSPRLEQIKFHYELPDLYKIKTDDFSNVYPVSILVPEIKITCPDQPELVNSDPYGEGWIIKIKPSDLGDLDSLMDVATYQAFVAH